MDASLEWFQQEQCGPALVQWTKIHDTHLGFLNESSNNAEDKTTQACDTSGKARKTEFLNNSDGFSQHRSKRKSDNKASTYGLNSDCFLIRKYGGTPWVVKGKLYGLGLIGLEEEINDFYLYMTPTPAEHHMRLEVVQRITKIIGTLWPHAKVEVYGSFQTGLYLPTSDIDLVVIENKEISFRLLEKTLLENNIAEPHSIKVLDKASVPIVKLTDAKTDIKVDISFNMNNGVKSANLIKEFMTKYPVLPKLVLVLKQFLLQRNLSEVFLGGISSYSLILLTVSFLQQHFKHQNTPQSNNLGNLLILFFDLYGRRFNYFKTGITIKNGGDYFTKDDFSNNRTDGNRPSILCIEDPLLPGNDIGRSSYGALNVKTAFCNAYHDLNKVVRQPDSVLYRNESILGRIVRVTDDVIEYRKWIQDTFPVESQSSQIPINLPNDSSKRVLERRVNDGNELSPQSTFSDSRASVGSFSGSASSSSSITSDTECDYIPETFTSNKNDSHYILPPKPALHIRLDENSKENVQFSVSERQNSPINSPVTAQPGVNENANANRLKCQRSSKIATNANRTKTRNPGPSIPTHAQHHYNLDTYKQIKTNSEYYQRGYANKKRMPSSQKSQYHSGPNEVDIKHENDFLAR